MRIQHVVFDWDGTLANTYPVISSAYDYTFDKLDLPRIPYDEVKQITSTLQNKDTLGHIFGERKQEASSAYYEFIAAHHATNLEAIPHSREVIDFCRNNGIKTYLITNKKTLYVAEEIKKLGFEGLFDKIVAAGEYAEDKPHQIATHAVFDDKIPEANTILVVGDGDADYKTARTYDHNNQKAICIIYDPKHTYNASKPDYIVTGFKEIIDIIKDI